MKIVVSNNAIADYQMHKKISPISARNEVSGNLNSERRKLENRNIQDKQEVRKNIKLWEKTMDRVSPEQLSPQVKNEMWKRAKSLKDEFIVGMLSTDELHPVKAHEINGVVQVLVDEDIMRSTNAVARQVEWNNKMGSKVKEYKNIMRHLNPEDPNASDIEKFRPSGRIK